MALDWASRAANARHGRISASRGCASRSFLLNRDPMGRIARTTLRIILVSLCVLVCGGFLASIGKVHVVERLRYTIEHRYVWTRMSEVYARQIGRAHV